MRDPPAFQTLLNYKQDRSLDESIKTFAHEVCKKVHTVIVYRARFMLLTLLFVIQVAHSFNALHDNEFEENEECFNKVNKIKRT